MAMGAVGKFVLTLSVDISANAQAVDIKLALMGNHAKVISYSTFISPHDSSTFLLSFSIALRSGF